MDIVSIVEDTERTRFRPQTGGRTLGRSDGQTDKMELIYPSFNFVEAEVWKQQSDKWTYPWNTPRATYCSLLLRFTFAPSSCAVRAIMPSMSTVMAADEVAVSTAAANGPDNALSARIMSLSPFSLLSSHFHIYPWLRWMRDTYGPFQHVTHVFNGLSSRKFPKSQECPC